jgi:uncharacterized membrane-anchored protein
MLLFSLLRAEKTLTEAAATVGCSIETARYWSQLITVDTTDLAKTTLRSRASDIALRLSKTTHAPTMLETLRDLGVSEKKAPAGESKGGVTVVIGALESQVQVSIVDTQTLTLSPQDRSVIHSVSEGD